MSELKELVNAPELVQAFGRSYEIKKFTLGPMTQAFEYVGPLSYLLGRLASLPQQNGKVDPSSAEWSRLLAEAITISGPSVFGLISVATKEPPEWLEDQDPMDGLRIFAKVVEKNLDFFSPDNLSQFVELVSGLAQKTQQLGGGPSIP